MDGIRDDVLHLNLYMDYVPLYLPAYVLDSDSLATFKCKLKTHLLTIDYTVTVVTWSVPLKLWHCGASKICVCIGVSQTYGMVLSKGKR